MLQKICYTFFALFLFKTVITSPSINDAIIVLSLATLISSIEYYKKHVIDQTHAQLVQQLDVDIKLFQKVALENHKSTLAEYEEKLKKLALQVEKLANMIVSLKLGSGMKQTFASSNIPKDPRNG